MLMTAYIFAISNTDRPRNWVRHRLVLAGILTRAVVNVRQLAGGKWLSVRMSISCNGDDAVKTIGQKRLFSTSLFAIAVSHQNPDLI